MKADNRNGLFRLKTTGGLNFSLIAVFVGETTKSSLPLMEGNFGQFLAKFKE